MEAVENRKEQVLMTRKEAADYLRMSLTTFDRFLKKCHPNCVLKIDRKVLIVKESLDEWIGREVS